MSAITPKYRQGEGNERKVGKSETGRVVRCRYLLPKDSEWQGTGRIEVRRQIESRVLNARKPFGNPGSHGSF